MLESILEIVSNVAKDTISKSSNVPSAKKDIAIKVSIDAITTVLNDNLGSVPELFLSNGPTKGIMNDLQKSITNLLIKKIGLDSDVTRELVETMLSSIVNSLGSKINSEEDTLFDVKSVVSALSELDDKSYQKSKESLLGAFSKLLQ